MEKETKNSSDPDVLEEYNFAEGMRGKYAQQYAAGSNVVLLDPDVAEVFPDSASANHALRALIDIIRQHSSETYSPQ